MAIDKPQGFTNEKENVVDARKSMLGGRHDGLYMLLLQYELSRNNHRLLFSYCEPILLLRKKSNSSKTPSKTSSELERKSIEIAGYQVDSIFYQEYFPKKV